MPSSVSYDGYKLEPANLFSYVKNYAKTEDGVKIGASYVFTLNFVIVADRGSPRSGLDGTISTTGFSGFNNLFWNISGYATRETIPADKRLAAIERKQEAIRALFSNDGRLLEVQSASGDQPLKAYCTVQSINFSEGVWVNTCNCTIVLESNAVSILGTISDEDLFSQYINSGSETWDVTTNENPVNDTSPRTYTISHTVQANGKHNYETGLTGWENAKAWVLPKLGVDPTFFSSDAVEDLPAGHITNHIRSESIGKNNGSYSVTETWLISPEKTIKDYTVETTDNLESSLKTVTVNGQITGLEERDSSMVLTTSKYTNADTEWTSFQSSLHTIAQTISGLTLNVIPNSKSVSINKANGTISWNYSYDNRPTTYITGARSERITISHNHQGDIYASLPILGGGSFGPVLQNLNCKTQKRKTLSISAILDPQTIASFTFPNISAIVTAATPTGSMVLTEPPEENLTVDGNYNYSITWVYR